MSNQAVLLKDAIYDTSQAAGFEIHTSHQDTVRQGAAVMQDKLLASNEGTEQGPLGFTAPYSFPLWSVAIRLARLGPS